MLAKTIVEDINFYAPYIQICDNQHTCLEHAKYFTYVKLGHNDI
jgi:hypothetical protein